MTSPEGRDENTLVRLYNAGHTLQAVSELRVSTEAGLERPLEFENAWVCLNIAAGRYRKVLAWAEQVRPELLGDFNALRDADVLTRVNVGEAMVNLGQWKRALDLVPRVNADQYEPRDSRIAGVATSLRAWILWLSNEPRIAHMELSMTQPLVEALDDYRAEFFMMHALVSASLKQFSLADQLINRAETNLSRVSSARNFLVTKARVARAQGDQPRALEWYRTAAEHEYRLQNGEGLLEWGDLLRDSNRVSDARTAWNLAVERDEESTWARVATERLAQG